jgi:DnaJ like chaperone protein
MPPLKSLFCTLAAYLLGDERAAKMRDALRAEFIQAKVYFKVPKPPWWLRLYLLWPAGEWRAQFFDAAFSMLGKMAGADQAVRWSEFKAVEAFIDEQLELDIHSKTRALEAFTRARQSSASFQSCAAKYARMFQRSRAMLELMIDVLLSVAYADDLCSNHEEQLLRTALDIFGLKEQDYARLRAKHLDLQRLKRAQTEEEMSQAQRYSYREEFRQFGHEAPKRTAPPSPLDRCYRILGCSSADTIQTVKAKYRKLVLQYHPDRLAAQGMPPEFTKFSTKRFREIQEAYDAIAKGAA